MESLVRHHMARDTTVRMYTRKQFKMDYWPSCPSSPFHVVQAEALLRLHV